MDVDARPVTVKGSKAKQKAQAMLQQRQIHPSLNASPTKPLVGGFFEDGGGSGDDTASSTHVAVGDSRVVLEGGDGGRNSVVRKEFSVVSFDIARQRFGGAGERIQLDSSFTTNQSDAGFQVNLASDAGIAVADVSARGDTSSPVALLQRNPDSSRPLGKIKRGRQENEKARMHVLVFHLQRV